MKSIPEKIVLASGNKKKLTELQLLLQPLGITVIPQSVLGISDAIENGLTFAENAIIKARHAATTSGLPAIADDSGLEVDALHGAPGIYSARFAVCENILLVSNDDNNNQLLLEKMRNIPDEKRRARFQCALAYVHCEEDTSPLICQGSWEGKILREPLGQQGFGYDPLFWVPTHSCSAAQLSVEEKSKISHRGTAMKKLLLELKLYYG